MAPTLASQLTISASAYLFNGILKLCSKSVNVEGLPILLDALKEGTGNGKGKGRAIDVEVNEQQPRRRGVVTVCNHNSVLDDPTMFSITPAPTYWPFASASHTSRNTRWTLGASDIMFTRPLHSKFFTLGQVIETFRGQGIFQPAVDRAVKLLQDGEWIHVFPEGKVNQPISHPEGGLIRFKWGLGRIIMDSKVMPEIIPIWISGFDQLMPETRTFPRFFPRFGARISITIGQPITSKIQPLVDRWRDIASQEGGTVGIGGDWDPEGNSVGGDKQREVRSRGDLAGGKEEETRIKITDVLQEEVRLLGEEVERREGRFDRGEWSQSRRRKE